MEINFDNAMKDITDVIHHHIKKIVREKLDSSNEAKTNFEYLKRLPFIEEISKQNEELQKENVFLKKEMERLSTVVDESKPNNIDTIPKTIDNHPEDVASTKGNGLSEEHRLQREKLKKDFGVDLVDVDTKHLDGDIKPPYGDIKPPNVETERIRVIVNDEFDVDFKSYDTNVDTMTEKDCIENKQIANKNDVENNEHEVDDNEDDVDNNEDEVESEVEDEEQGEDEVEDEVEEKRTKIKRFDSVVKQIKVIKNFLITEITKPKNKIMLELVFILLLIKYFV